MLFWMCGGISLPLVFVVEDLVAEPFFLRRIMRGADFLVGVEAADGSASVVMVMMAISAFYAVRALFVVDGMGG